MKPLNLSFDSQCVQAIRDNSKNRPHQLPIYATSSFAFDTLQQGMDIFTGQEDGHLYSRFGNPTIDSVAQKLAQLESFGLTTTGSCVLTSSGMSAISTLAVGLLQQGDTIITQQNLYGGTTELFKKVLMPFGVKIVFTDIEDLDALAKTIAAEPTAKLVYIETPANPTLACVSIEAIATLAHKNQCQLIVDNTFSTPYLQRPLSHGADFVVHSTTKYLNGHGNSIAGAIIGKDPEQMKDIIWPAMKLLGTNCNPWDAWLINNGLKTLALRMEKHSSNALFLAEWLSTHPSVKTVNYPALAQHPSHEIAMQQMSMAGGMLSFELKDGLEAGMRFVDQLQLCTIAPTLGDVDTLILHPASMSHLNIPKAVRESQGITDGLIRISVGIEKEEDIKKDLEQALVQLNG